MKVVLSAFLFIASVCWAGFHSVEFTANDLGNGWYEHDQYGTFYDSNKPGWFYHIDHGWIFVNEWNNNGTWAYSSQKGSDQNTHFNFSDGNFTSIIDWNNLYTDTGLSLEFITAVAEYNGIDLNTSNEGSEEVHLSLINHPFGWLWLGPVKRNFVYNYSLGEWLYFNQDNVLYYSYPRKSYVSRDGLKSFIYKKNVWREAFASFFTSDDLNGLERFDYTIEENKKPFPNDSAGWIIIEIPHAQLASDSQWSPFYEVFEKLSQEPNPLFSTFENGELINLEIKSLFRNFTQTTFAKFTSGFYDLTIKDEVELNEVDYERQASAKGLDENGSKEAIVLEKTGLIDLENEDHAGKIDKYIEVAVVASRKIDEPLEERRAYYSSKSLDQFIADLVSNFEAVVDVTIEAESIGVKDQAMFDSLLEDAQNADDVKKMVDVAASVGAKTKEDLEQVFKSVGTADSLVKVVDATASLDAAESFRDKNTLGAVFRNANQAEALAEVVSDDTSADKEKKLRSLFTVIKPVDKKKTASKALKEREAIIIDFIPHTVKIELGNLFDSKSLEDKYKDYDASGLYNAEQLSLIKDYKDARVSDVSLANFFSGIKNVVDVTEILIEIASSNDGVSLDNLLDGVVKHADQVTDFKANMEAVLADDNLKGDIGALLENPGNQKAFAKVREEFGGDSAKMKKAVEKFAVVDDLSDAIETANKLKWAGIEFDANVLFNALDLVDPKVASDQENFFESLNRLSDSVQSDFGADESITLLEEAFKNPEKATSLNNLMKASASATDDQKKALLLSAASADTLETEFNSVSGDSTKSANFLTTVQSIGEKKTKAKALAAEARDSAVSDTIKTEIANITSVSALKTKFFELLPASITDENVKKNLFKANERTQPAGVADPVLNVQEILNNAGIATDSSEYNTIKDLWIVANARKNTIISEEGFKNIAALSDIASNSGGSALDVLDSALENVEEVQQFAVLVEVGGVDVTNFDPDSFDFEVAFESVLRTSSP